MGLGTAGQALGGPGPAVVQLRVVLLGEADVAEQADGGFGGAAVGLAGLQSGDPGRLLGVGGADVGRGRRVPGSGRDVLHAGQQDRKSVV